MLLREFGLYGIILFMTMFTALEFPLILNGQFTSDTYKSHV
jgi:hypothetical protein